MLFLMRFQPVLSPAGIRNQRNLELIGILHFLYHDFLYLLIFLWINREVEFIVYPDDHLTLDALCLESVEDLHRGNLDDVGF